MFEWLSDADSESNGDDCIITGYVGPPENTTGSEEEYGINN